MCSDWEGWFVMHGALNHVFFKSKTIGLDRSCRETNMRWCWETWDIPITLGPLRLTTHLPNAVAIAITVVALVLDDFVPGFSDLVEGLGLWFLALICWSKPENIIEWKPREIWDSPTAQRMNQRTHRQRRTSSVHVPVRSRCSSSCSPRHGVWKTAGWLHSKCHRRCTGLLAEEG